MSMRLVALMMLSICLSAGIVSLALLPFRRLSHLAAAFLAPVLAIVVQYPVGVFMDSLLSMLHVVA